MTINFIRDLILAIINAQLVVINKQKDDLVAARIELNDYINSVDLLIADLEEQKKKFSSEAVSLLFFEISTNQTKEITDMIQKVTETKKFGFVAKDAKGNVAAVESAQWALSNPALGELLVEGNEVTFTPAGAVGECELQLAVDALIGEGEVVLNGTLPITLIPGEAVTIEISAL